MPKANKSAARILKQLIVSELYVFALAFIIVAMGRFANELSYPSTVQAQSSYAVSIKITFPGATGSETNYLPTVCASADGTLSANGHQCATVAGLNQSGVGAQVKNLEASGAHRPTDLVFSTVNGCGSGILTWDINTYEPVHGALNASINVGGTFTSSTTIYMCFGDAAVTTFQGGSPYPMMYKAVYHMGNGSTIVDLTDHTGNGYNGTNNSMTAAAGVIGGEITGTSSAFVTGAAGSITGPSLTFGTWTSGNTFSATMFGKSSATAEDFFIYQSLGSIYYTYITNSSAIQQGCSTGITSANGVQHLVGASYDGANITPYGDGVAATPCSLTGNVEDSASSRFGWNELEGMGTGANISYDETFVIAGVMDANWWANKYANESNEPAYVTFTQTIAPAIYNVMDWETNVGGMGAGNSTSCMRDDLNAYINGPIHAVQDGDVFLLNTGVTMSCTYQHLILATSNPTVGYTILGAGTTDAHNPSGDGTHTTTIVDDDTTDGFLFTFTSAYGASLSRIGQMYMTPQASTSNLANPFGARGSCTAGSAGASNCPNLRIDHVVFPVSPGWGISVVPNSGTMIVTDNMFGPLDHNSFYWDATGGNAEFVNVNHTAWQGVGRWGDNSWSQPSFYDGAQAIDVELNYFDNTGAGSKSNLFGVTETEATTGASWNGAPMKGGGRMVCRFNQFVGLRSDCVNHGTESNERPRSGRLQTRMFNQLTCPTGSPCNIQGLAANWRGGTFINIGNTLSGTPSFAHGNYGPDLSVFRINSGDFAPWNACDGAARWDNNGAGTVYDSGTMTAFIGSIVNGGFTISGMAPGTSGSHANTTQSSTTGSGTGASLTVSWSGTTYTSVSVASSGDSGGSGYEVTNVAGDHVVFAGTNFGGTSPTNDLTITLTGVDQDLAMTVVDNSKTWTPTNKWAPAVIAGLNRYYAIHDTSTLDGAAITSSGSDTMGFPNPGFHHTWNLNDPYQILRPESCLDSESRSGGTLLQDTSSIDSTPTPTNTSGGWQNPTLDPIYEVADKNITYGYPSPGLPLGVFLNATPNVDYYMSLDELPVEGGSAFNGTSGAGWGLIADIPNGANGACTNGTMFYGADAGNWNPTHIDLPSPGVSLVISGVHYYSGLPFVCGVHASSGHWPATLDAAHAYFVPINLPNPLSVAGPAMIFHTQPSNTHTGNAMTSFQVYATTDGSTVDTSVNSSITLTDNSCGTTWTGGTLTVTFVSGVGTYTPTGTGRSSSNCTLSAALMGYTSATSNAFWIGPNQMTITSQPSSSYASGTSAAATIGCQFGDGSTDAACADNNTATMIGSPCSGSISGGTNPKTGSGGSNAFTLTVTSVSSTNGCKFHFADNTFSMPAVDTSTFAITNSGPAPSTGIFRLHE